MDTFTTYQGHLSYKPAKERESLVFSSKYLGRRVLTSPPDVDTDGRPPSAPSLKQIVCREVGEGQGSHEEGKRESA